MSVITSGKFYNLVSSGITSGCTYGTHHCFRTGIDHTHHFKRRNHFCHQFCHLHFSFRSSPETQSFFTCFDHGFFDRRMVVSEDHRSPGTDKIQIFVSIDIGHINTVCLFNKTRRAANTSKSTHRAVHATRHQSNCFFKKFF